MVDQPFSSFVTIKNWDDIPFLCDIKCSFFTLCHKTIIFNHKTKS